MPQNPFGVSETSILHPPTGLLATISERMEPSTYKSSNCFSTDVCHLPMGVSLHSPWVPAEGPWWKRGPGALTGCCTHRASREGGETSWTSEASHSSFKGSPPGFVLMFLVAKKFWKSKQYNIHHVHFGHIGKRVVWRNENRLPGMKHQLRAQPCVFTDSQCWASLGPLPKIAGWALNRDWAFYPGHAHSPPEADHQASFQPPTASKHQCAINESRMSSADRLPALFHLFQSYSGNFTERMQRTHFFSSRFFFS